VGSPRIDRRLAPYRDVDTAQLRTALLNEMDAAQCTRVMMLATQPISWEKSRQIVETCLDAMPPDMLLLVRLHPVEGADRRALYEQLLSQARPKVTSVIDGDADIYARVAAVDVVATYFSTLAIESFGLGKTLAIVDPFDHPPSLDFAAHGVGERATDAATLKGIIENASARGDTPVHSSNPYLSILQDGGSSKRIEGIVDRLRQQARAQ